MLDCYTPQQFSEIYAADIADRQEQQDIYLELLAAIRSDIHNAMLLVRAAVLLADVKPDELREPADYMPGTRRRQPTKRRIDPQAEQAMLRQRHAGR